MKKFVTVCAILALAFFIIGGGMFYLGAKNVNSLNVKEAVDKLTNGVMSFDLDYENWDWEWIENSAVYDINTADTFDKDYPIYSREIDKTIVTAKEVSKMDLAVGGYSIAIEDSGNDKISIKGENVGKMQAFVKNNTLYVKALHENGVDISNAKITLYIPKDIEYKDLEIAVGAGNLEFENLRSEKINISVGAGKIKGEGLISKSVNATVGAGAIYLYGVEAEKAELTVSMGDCEFGRSITKELTAVCTMGNLSLYLEGDMEDYNVDYACTFGTVKIGGREYKEGENSINNGASKNMELVCTMGNIDVNF